MRHKGPIVRPRCIGPGRTRTQIPFSSIQVTICPLLRNIQDTSGRLTACYTLLHWCLLPTYCYIWILTPWCMCSIVTTPSSINVIYLLLNQWRLSTYFPLFFGRTMSHPNSSYKHVFFFTLHYQKPSLVNAINNCTLLYWQVYST